MKKPWLHDWNDARLLIACAELGSFARAATALGIDQTTASRRITLLEEAVGRPLFTRRRSGASLTPAGKVLVEQAKQLEASVDAFEETMEGLKTYPAPVVRVAAAEGLLTYTLIPALLDSGGKTPTIDRSLLRAPPPELAFTTAWANADIAVLGTNPGEVPPISGPLRVRKIGTMSLIPVVTKAFMDIHPEIRRFEDLRDVPLADNEVYRTLRGLDEWNALVAEREDESVVVTPNTPSLVRSLLSGQTATILPPYSPLIDDRVLPLDVTAPPLSIDLWLAAREDDLREPAVRILYDSLGEMFLASHWFRRLN